MTRGRKPTSDKQKQLRGTDQPVRMRGEMAIKKIETMPPPPEWFNDHSRNMYHSLAGTLARLGLITEIDFPAFVAMCEEYGTYYELTIELKTVPMRAKMAKDAERVYRRMKTARNEAWEKFYKLSSDFGLTPAARLRFMVKEEKRDELTELMEMD